MAQLIFGDRIAKTAKLRIGATAIRFDESGEKILLTRRAGNGCWRLPGGGMDAGEDLAETCIRKMKEETGLDVKVKRLIGIYSSPHYNYAFCETTANPQKADGDNAYG